MSWLVKAFTMGQEKGVHFLLTDPVSFYEMKYTKTIPSGTEVSMYLPPSDIFAEDIILASAKIPSHAIEKGVTTEDVKSDLTLKIGRLLTPHEVCQRFVRLDSNFKRQLKDFKDTSLSQEYIISRTETPKLYRVSEGFGDTAQLEFYGTLQDVSEKSQDMRKSLTEQASKKTGRSYEAADWRRIENIFTYINNNNLLPLDPIKIAFLLRKAEIKPIAHTEENWVKCFTDLDDDAKKLSSEIKRFHSMKWVQSLLNPYR